MKFNNIRLTLERKLVALLVLNTLVLAGMLFVNFHLVFVVPYLITSLLCLSLAYDIHLVRNKAYRDHLTGLPNRRAFERELNLTIRTCESDRTKFAVMLIDLDRFKIVNDTLGHKYGDELLKFVTLRLRKVFKTHDMIARLGGDEFAIILKNVDREAMNTVGHRLVNAFRDPFELNHRYIDVGVSAGIAFYPYTSEDQNELMRKADIAMYYAKSNRSGYFIYDPDKDKHRVEDLSLVSSLRTAIKQSQLEVYYQPKKRLDTNQIDSVEALVRWNHPTLGLLTPDMFIPFAEQTGAINDLTPWVIRRVCAQVLEWKKVGIDLRVSVNISPQYLVNPELLAVIGEEINNTDLDASALIFEVTETTILANPESTMKVMLCLDMLGITLSIDDFGTGHSSLLYLKHLPIKEIKIDRVFVMSLLERNQDYNIIRSTIHLAHEIGCAVVAEGVENRETQECLRDLGCDSIQGYYLSKPVPVNKITMSFIQDIQNIS